MAPKDFSPDDLLPGTGIGAYVVRSMLGQGGSSSVYEVESAEGHRFALKICRYPGNAPSTSESRVDQRYSRSIACLQLLKGRRNVAELYAHDRYPDPLHGYQYLVQELVPGGLLITDWARRESPTLRKLAGAFVELAELCGVMASKGICHRDLKPANILVTPDGTPKVIDFESATCPHAEPVTQGETSAEPGTGGWQRPEVCQAIVEEESREKRGRKKKGNEASGFRPWGDLFSLGVVFYECLTGEYPFDNLPDGFLLEEGAFETPAHPVRLGTTVPPGLNKVVMKLMEKRPGARYREGAEVAKDLRRLLKAKDRRWDEPFKQPVPDEEEAPVLPFVSPFVALEAPALDAPAPGPGSVREKDSERPVLATPSTEPHSVDAGASAEAEAGGEATSSPRSARQGASPRSAVTDKDVLLQKKSDKIEPQELPEGEPAAGTVLDLGKAGAYTLEECLGRGGYGEVYRARQVGAAGFVQWVAIKRLRPGSQPREARSFVDEARVLSRLHHENIPRVYAFHEWKGSYYLVMEHIEGHSLHALLELARRKGHRFSESVACAVMADVADALHHAHHATDEADRPLHIVHRDVSPSNILITKEGRVVLVDFGTALSEVEGRTATRTGSTVIKGKVPYLSPEQAKHLPLDARSDQFSVGTILVELLTGEAPFGWTADELTLLRIASVTPEYVASHLPGVSEPLRALCQKLLAHHPDQRFATGLEVATALRRHPRLHEGPQSIRAEVEKLQALPDARTPPAPAPVPVVAARALSEVKRARRTVALASVAMLATLVLASWYVPRRVAVLVPSSPSLHGPIVALTRPPAAPVAPAPPLLPPPGNPLAGKPKQGGDAAASAGPLESAPTELSAPPVVRAGKTPPVPLTVTASPAGKRADSAGASVDSEESRSMVREQLVVAQNAQLDAMRAQLAKMKEEASMPDHAVAALMVSEHPELTSLFRLGQRRADRGGRKAKIEVFVSHAHGESMVAVIVTMKNPRDAVAWEPTEARVKVESQSTRHLDESVRWGSRIPAAVRSVPARIVPGQMGRIAVVFDKNDVGLDTAPVVVELLREGQWEFEFILQPSDLVASSKAEGP